MDGLIAEGSHEHPYDYACWPDGPNANGPFDCVNKPQYGCQEQVTIAASRCSLCRVSKTERTITHKHFRPSYIVDWY